MDFKALNLSDGSVDRYKNATNCQKLLTCT